MTLKNKTTDVGGCLSTNPAECRGKEACCLASNLFTPLTPSKGTEGSKCFCLQKIIELGYVSREKKCYSFEMKNNVSFETGNTMVGQSVCTFLFDLSVGSSLYQPHQKKFRWTVANLIKHMA